MNEYYEKLAELAKTMPEPHRKVFENLMSLIEGKDTQLELAWGVIANAGGGAWDTQTEEWQAAAVKWRDKYLKTLN